MNAGIALSGLWHQCFLSVSSFTRSTKILHIQTGHHSGDSMWITTLAPNVLWAKKSTGGIVHEGLTIFKKMRILRQHQKWFLMSRRCVTGIHLYADRWGANYNNGIIHKRPPWEAWWHFQFPLHGCRQEVVKVKSATIISREIRQHRGSKEDTKSCGVDSIAAVLLLNVSVSEYTHWQYDSSANHRALQSNKPILETNSNRWDLCWLLTFNVHITTFS